MSWEINISTLPNEMFFREAAAERLLRYFRSYIFDASYWLIKTLNQGIRKERPGLSPAAMPESFGEIGWIDIILAMPDGDARVQIYYSPGNIDVTDDGSIRQAGEVVISFGELEGVDAADDNWTLFMAGNDDIEVWNKQAELSRWMTDKDRGKIIFGQKTGLAKADRELVGEIIKELSVPGRSVRRISWRKKEGDPPPGIGPISGGGRRVGAVQLTLAAERVGATSHGL